MLTNVPTSIKELLGLPHEQAILFIESVLKSDPYYTEDYGSYTDIARGTFPVINSFIAFDDKNPLISGYNEKVFFKADDRTIKRDGLFIGSIKYAAHFVTQYTKDGVHRTFDSSKDKHIGLLLDCILNPENRLSETANENKIYYTKKYTFKEKENTFVSLFEVAMDLDGHICYITIMPNKSKNWVDNKKKGNEFLDSLPKFQSQLLQNPKDAQVSGTPSITIEHTTIKEVDTNIQKKSNPPTNFNENSQNTNNQNNTTLKTGGSINNKHSTMKHQITPTEIASFKAYITEFYGPNGIYEHFFKPLGATEQEIDNAIEAYIKQLNIKQPNITWGGGDSVDRERVRNLMLQARGLPVPLFDNGGNIDASGDLKMKILNLKTDLAYQAHQAKNFDEFKTVWDNEYEKTKRLANDVFYAHQYEAKSILNAMDHIYAQNFYQQAIGMATGGPVTEDDVRLKYAKKDVALLEKNGSIAITDTKHGVLWLEYTPAVYIGGDGKGKEFFKGDKQTALNFIKDAYIVEGFENGGRIKSQTSVPQKGVNTNDVATVLIISSKNPLNTQLQNLFGSTGVTDLEPGSPSILRHNETGRIIVVYTLNYFAQVDKYVIEDDLKRVKIYYHVKDFYWPRKPQFKDGGPILTIGDDVFINDPKSLYNQKPGVIVGDEGNMWLVKTISGTGLVHKNKVQKIENNFADGGNVPSGFLILVTPKNKPAYISEVHGIVNSRQQANSLAAHFRQMFADNYDYISGAEVISTTDPRAADYMKTSSPPFFKGEYPKGEGVTNLIDIVATHYPKTVKDYGVTEAFIDSFGEFRITSNYPVPFDTATEIEHWVLTNHKPTFETGGEITAEYVGEDDWNRKLYKASNGVTYASVDGQLYVLTDEGEPLYPTRKNIKITTEAPSQDYKHTYMMLGRLQSDNDYFLGYGNRNEKRLWAGSVDAQITEMKRLWNQLPENKKPEWLSYHDILDYETKMKESFADGGKVTQKSIDAFTEEHKHSLLGKKVLVDGIERTITAVKSAEYPQVGVIIEADSSGADPEQGEDGAEYWFDLLPEKFTVFLSGEIIDDTDNGETWQLQTPIMARGGKIKNIDEETALLPEAMAQGIAENSAEHILRTELQNWDKLNATERKALDEKYRNLTNKIADYLVLRANTTYKNNEQYRKAIKKDNNAALNYMEKFMQHWAGFWGTKWEGGNGKLEKTIERYYADVKKASGKKTRAERSRSMEEGGDVSEIKNKADLENAIKAVIKKYETNLEYYGSVESEQDEAKIITAEKNLFGYNFEEHDDATEYFSKATMEEIWQYHLDTILPKLTQPYAELKADGGELNDLTTEEQSAFDAVYKKFADKDYFELKNDIERKEQERLRYAAQGNETALKTTKADIEAMFNQLNYNRALGQYKKLKKLVETSDPELKKYLRANQKFTIAEVEVLTGKSLKGLTNQKALDEFVDSLPAKKETGGHISFTALEKKVAKQYVGKPVPKKYQKEYGKVYSKDEAKVVGIKVANKVKSSKLKTKMAAKLAKKK